MKEGVSKKTKQQKKRRIKQRKNAGRGVILKYEELGIPAPSHKSISEEGKLLAKESEQQMQNLFMSNITVNTIPYRQNFELMNVKFNEKAITEWKKNKKLPYEDTKVNKLIEEYKSATILYFQHHSDNELHLKLIRKTRLVWIEKLQGAHSTCYGESKDTSLKKVNVKMYHFYSKQHKRNNHKYMKTLEHGGHFYSLENCRSFGIYHGFKEIFDHFSKHFDVNAGTLHMNQEMLSDIQSPILFPSHLDKRDIAYVIFVPLSGYIFVWIAVPTDEGKPPFPPCNSYSKWMNEIKTKEPDWYKAFQQDQSRFEKEALREMKVKDVTFYAYKIGPGDHLAFPACLYYHVQLRHLRKEKL